MKPPKLSDHTSESALMGSILINPRILDECLRHGVTKDFFILPACRISFGAVQEIIANNNPVDLISVTNTLEKQDKLSDAGGPGAIADLFTFVPTASNFSYYLDLVKRDHAIRVAKKEVEKLGKDFCQCVDSPSLLATMANAFKDVMPICSPPPSASQNDILLSELMDELEAIATGTKTAPIYSCPLMTVNRKAGGTMDGEVTGINGPESSGKSLLGKQFISNLCFNHNFPCAVFTMEMAYRQWMIRLMCEMGEIKFNNMRTGRLEDHETRRMLATYQKIIDTKRLHIYDSKRIRMSDVLIEQEIRKLAKNDGIRAVLIDYLQLMEITNKNDRRADQEIGDNANMFKRLAQEFGLHIFVVTAANEKGAVSDSRKPHYAFDNILNMIVSTEDGKNGKPPKITTERIMVSKWRDGERGYAINVEMEGQFCRFKDITIP